jgi:hypothetical protein
MRRLLLTVGMLLMGMALVGGAAVSLVGSTLLPLDQEVGTHASAAGAVLGIGLMAAAINPAANVGWVRAGILYGFVVLAFEGGAWYLWRTSFHWGPVFFGLAFSLLLIATYPQRNQLIPAGGAAAGKRVPVPAHAPAEVKTPPAPEKEPAQESDVDTKD